MNRVAALYRQYYVDMAFERAGLFEQVQRHFQPRTILYPGASFHITPSFYFPHVVYVDQGEHARQFFADSAAVRDLINRRKRYPQSAYFRYLPQDFTGGLPLRTHDFDLLIALYAGGIARSCRPYLKPGGILLTNNHQDDAGQAAADADFQLIAVIHEKRNRYVVSDQHLAQYFVRKDPISHKSHRDYGSSKPIYTTNADYYLFRHV